MSDQGSFDSRVASHFGREHSHVPGDIFVTATMQKVRTERRRAEVMHTGLRVAALMVAIILSPWLIAGAVRLNAALESSVAWMMTLPGAWIAGVAAVVVVVVAMRLRGR